MIGMFIKKFNRQSIRFRVCFIGCIVLLTIPSLLFIRNRSNFHLVIINVLNGLITTQHNTCIIHECTKEQSKKHGDLFASFPPIWSGCYSDSYLTAFDDANTAVHVLIDVGANKGYAVATWLSFFLPELNITQARLGHYISSTKHFDGSCGSCDDCKDEPIKRINNQQKLKLQIHAFEPQPATVDVLKDIKNWMNIKERNDLIFEIHGMAVSDRTGQILFKKCNAGNEVCSLDVSDASANQQIHVDVIALDDFADKRNLKKIDILKIDTEGYEPLVFRGAKRLLKEHRIRLFIFEHLQRAAWSNTSLQIEISNLFELGYVCYMIGKTGVIRVSNCWNEQFNTRHSNALCVSKKETQLLYNIDRMKLVGSIETKCGISSNVR